jgi:hypothetical protein
MGSEHIVEQFVVGVDLALGNRALLKISSSSVEPCSRARATCQSLTGSPAN